MVILKQPEYNNLGYNAGAKGNSSRHAWLQYADDACVVTSNVKNAQCLLNLFQAWCNWSGLELRNDKCVAFSMMKKDKKYQQILPTLNICSKSIPQVPLGGEFKYLGKTFEFDTSLNSVKTQLQEKLTKMLTITDKLKISVQLKMRIFSQYIQAQMLFELKIYDLTPTWVEQTLDSLCSKFIREWLELPISACLNEVLILPKNQGGFGMNSFKMLADKMHLIKRHALINSHDDDLISIAYVTVNSNCRIDEYIAANNTVDTAKKSLKSDYVKTAAQHILNLQLQGQSFKEIHRMITKPNISIWSKAMESISATKLIFARKALSQVLPTAANLVRWKRSTDPICHQYTSGLPQTNKHVLSNCSSDIALRRYTKRHDDILTILMSWIKSELPVTSLLYADLPCSDCLSISDLFVNCRPDIAVCDRRNITILELTVCHETNLEKSRNFKVTKYANIEHSRTAAATQLNVALFTCEVSTLGFISDISTFAKNCKLPKMPESVKSAIINSAISNSYSIYCNRNNSNAIINN